MANVNSRVNVVIGGSISGSFGAAFNRAQDDINRVGSALEKTKRSLAQIDGYKKQVAAIKEHEAALESARSELEAYNRKVAETGQKVRKNDPELRRLTAAVSGSTRALERARTAAARFGEALTESGIATDRLERHQRRLEDGLERQSRAYDRMTRSARFAAAARQSVFDARADLGNAAVTIAPVALATRRVVGDSAVFGRENQLIANTEDLSPEATRRLRETTLATAKRFGINPQEQQAALGFTIASGAGVGAAVASLDSVTKASIATGTALEDVAAANVTLLQNLKMTPAEVITGFDAMAKAGKLGNVEFREMAQLMPSLASGAQAIGASGKGAVAQLGAALQIARRGAPTGAEAATNLENYIQKLMSPETIKKFDKLGVNITAEVAKWRKSGDDVIGESIKLVSKLTNGGDQGKLAQIFQDQQVQKFIRPMIQNYGDYIKIRDEALKANGVIATDFEKMEKTTFRTFQRAQSDIRIGFIRIGDAISPTVAGMAESVGKAAGALGDFAKAHPKLVAMGFTMAAGIAAITVVSTISRLAMWGAIAPIAGLVSRVVLLTSQFNLFGGAAGRVARHLNVVAARGLRFGAVMRMAGSLAMRFLITPVIAGVTALASTLGLPVVAVVAIGAAVVAAGVLVIRHIGAIKAFIGAAFTAVFGEGVLGKIGRFFGGILGFARPAFDWVKRKAEEIGKLLGKEIVTEEDGRRAGERFGRAFREAARPHLDVIGLAFEESGIPQAIDRGRRFFLGLADAFVAIFNERVKPIIELWGGLIRLFNSFGASFAGKKPGDAPRAPPPPRQPVTRSPVTAPEVTKALAAGAFSFLKTLSVGRAAAATVGSVREATVRDTTKPRGDALVDSAVRRAATGRAPVQHNQVNVTVNGVKNAADVPAEINKAYLRGTLLPSVAPTPLYDGAAF